MESLVREANAVALQTFISSAKNSAKLSHQVSTFNKLTQQQEENLIIKIIAALKNSAADLLTPSQIDIIVKEIANAVHKELCTLSTIEQEASLLSRLKAINQDYFTATESVQKVLRTYMVCLEDTGQIVRPGRH